MSERRYWLMKTEPSVFSIHDLERVTEEPWDGVRNYQARNYMRDDMQPGDGVLVYHSNARPPGVAGLARVGRVGLPDPTSWDPESKYFDPKSSPEAPRWFLVTVIHHLTLAELLPLERLRAEPALAGMPLLNKSRLSVQPVEPAAYQGICDLAGITPQDR